MVASTRNEAACPSEEYQDDRPQKIELLFLRERPEMREAESVMREWIWTGERLHGIAGEETAQRDGSDA